MFEITNLSVSVNTAATASKASKQARLAKPVLDGISLKLAAGEIHVIMGPNGAGKSSLANALLGHPSFEVTGSIKLNGLELVDRPTDERARAGIFLAFQNPEEIEGVKASTLIRKAISAKSDYGPDPKSEVGSTKHPTNSASLATTKQSRQSSRQSKPPKQQVSPHSQPQPQDIAAMMAAHEAIARSAEELGLDATFVTRDLNVGSSGGEKKRLEALQMLALKPKVVILDEIDSGLDVDGIRLVAQAISKLDDGSRTFLIITHYPRILKYIKPDFVHILMNGRIVKSGDGKLAHDIEKAGFAKYGTYAKYETHEKYGN